MSCCIGTDVANIPGHEARMQVFKVLLGRPQCIPDPTRFQRAGAKKWDTVKPLEASGLPLARTLLVDNEARKVLPQELDNLLLLPTWETCRDLGEAAWKQLITSLLELPDREQVDVRTCTASINQLLAAASGKHAMYAQLEAQLELNAKKKKKAAAGVAAAATAAAAGGGNTANPARQPAGPAAATALQPRPGSSREGAEPPCKLRRTAAAHDVRDAPVVSSNGYLLSAEELQGDGDTAGAGSSSDSEGDSEGLEALSDEEDDDGASTTSQSDSDSDGTRSESESGSEGGGGGGLLTDWRAKLQSQAGKDDEWVAQLQGHAGKDGGAKGAVAKLQAPAGNGDKRAAQLQGQAGREADAEQAGEQAGRKRGRQLPGAAALYSGPHALLPQTGTMPAAAGGGRAQAAGPSAAQHAQHAQHQPQLSALHYELAAFAAAAAPTDEQLDALEAAVATVQAAASRLWPQARAVLFGSQASGLALPGSDLDVVVLGVLPRDVDRAMDLQGQGGAVKRSLGKLLDQLSSTKVLAKYEIIRHAKVPIIKARMLVHKLLPHRVWTGSNKQAPTLAVDISLGAANGAAAVALMQRCVTALPPLRPLCLAVKALLKDAGLNEVFTGGLSSYAVFNLVLAHLQREGLAAAVAQALQAAHTQDLQAVQQATQQHTQRVKAGAAQQQQQQQPGASSSAQGQRADTHQSDDEDSQPTGAQAPTNGNSTQPALGSALLEFLEDVQRSSRSDSRGEGGWEAAGGGYDLGDLLASFLYRYGCVMDWSTEAVSVRQGGVIPPIHDVNSYVRPLLQRLVVEDPQQAERDLCSGSHAWPLTRQVLRAALQRLTARSPEQDPCTGLLRHLLRQGGHKGNEKTVQTVGELGRMLHTAVCGYRGQQSQRALARVCIAMNGWKGWSHGRQQPPPALVRMSQPHLLVGQLPPQAVPGQPGPASQAAGSGAGPSGTGGGQGGAKVDGDAEEAAMWAAVQREGSHVSEPFASLVQPASRPGAAGGANSQQPVQGVGASWAAQLSLLFDVHASVGLGSDRQQQQQPDQQPAANDAGQAPQRRQRGKGASASRGEWWKQQRMAAKQRRADDAQQGRNQQEQERGPPSAIKKKKKKGKKKKLGPNGGVQKPGGGGSPGGGGKPKSRGGWVGA